MWLADGEAQLAAPSQQSSRGGRARNGGRHASRVEDAGQQAVERPGGTSREAGPRRLRGQRRAGAVARADARSPRNTGVAGAVLEERHPYQAGDILKQPDLARSLERIADQGPAGFYEGETALLLEKEMKANNGLITREDLKKYQAKQRAPIRGTYRGYDIIGMAPPSSGGISVQMMLNMLEPHDLKANEYGSAKNVHLIAEAAPLLIGRSISATPTSSATCRSSG